MITPIERMNAIIKGQQPMQVLPNQYDNPFADIFHTAIDNVRETDAEKVQTQYLLATGQLDNPAAATIAASKSELALNLLVQLRNKALEAYSELGKISL